MNLGTLTIEMAANIARLQQDMAATKSLVGDAMGQVQSYANSAKDALSSMARDAVIGLSGLAAAASAVSFRNMITDALAMRAHMLELSEKTGVAVEQLSGLARAGKVVGVGADDIATALVKLNKNLAGTGEDSKGAAQALAALGIDFATFRSLAPDEQMLAVAHAMAEFKDGGDKAAAMMMLFGRTGADLLPMMKELATVTQLHGKLTTEAAEQAKQYERNMIALQAAADDWKRQLVTDLTPTLVAFTAQLLEGRKAYGGFMAAAVDIGLNVDPMKSLGKSIAETREQIDAARARLAELNAQQQSGSIYSKLFAGSIDAEKESIAKELTTLTARDNYLKSEQSRQALAGATGLVDEHRFTTEKATLKIQEHTKAVKEQADAYPKLRDEVQHQIDALQLQLTTGEKLSGSQQLALKIMEQLRDGTLKVSEQRRIEIATMLEQAIALERQIAQRDAEVKATMAAQEAHEKAYQSLGKEVAKVREQVEAQNLANEAVAVGKDASEMMASAKLREAADTAELNAIKVEEKNLDYAMGQQYREQAQALRDLADAKDKGVGLKAAQEAASAWQKTVDQISGSLSDALMRAFESGKGFAEAFTSTLKNAFKSLVLEPTIKAIMAPLTGTIGSLLGAGSAVAGTGGGLGNLANATGLLGGLGAFSGTLGTGFMSTLTGTGLGTTLGAAGDLVASGNMAAGLGLGFGAVAPWLLGAAALYSVFGGKGGGPQVGGQWTAANSINSGSLLSSLGTGVWGSLGDQNKLNSQMQGPTEALAASIASNLKMFGSGAGSVRIMLATNADPQGTSANDAHLMATLGNGRSVYMNRDNMGSRDASTFATQFADWQAQLSLRTLQEGGTASRYANYFGSFNADNQNSASVAQIIATAQSVQSLTAAVAPLGSVFSRIGSLSVEATSSLAKLTGGFEAFVQKAQSYVANFYSTSEQTAIKAAQINATLRAAGVDTSSLTDKSSFRAMVDATGAYLDSGTGQQQLAALLNVAADFASISDALGGSSLANLAATAPNGGVIGALTGGNQVDTTALLQSSADQLGQVNDNLNALLKVTQDAAAQAQAKLATVADNTGRAATAAQLADLIARNGNTGEHF